MLQGSKATRIGAGAVAANACKREAVRYDAIEDGAGRWVPAVWIRPDQVERLRRRCEDRGVTVIVLEGRE